MLQYEGKRVRGPNGEIGVIRGGQIVVEAAPGAPAPLRQVIAPPEKTPTPQNPEQRTGTILNNEGQELQNRVTADKPIYDRFGAIAKIRDDIRQDKRILTYETALPIFASALTSPNTPEADNLLVNAIAKIGDPMTGVQQREGAAYEGAAPAVEQIKARLLKEFGSDGAGNFSPEGRQRMKIAMRNRMSALADAYMSARGYWATQVQQSGIPNVDPESVLGPHFGEGFQQAEADFLGRRVGLRGGEYNPEGPTPQGGERNPAPGAPSGPTGNVASFADEPRAPNEAFMTDWRERNAGAAATFNQAYLDPKASYEQLLQLSQKLVDVGNDPEWPKRLRRAVELRDAGRPTSFAPGPVSNPLLDIPARGPDEGGNPAGMTGAFLTPQNVDAAVRGAADVGTAGLSDEIAAGADTLLGEGTYGENLWRQRGIDAYDEQNNPYARFAGQMAGAVVLPTGVQSAGLGAGRAAIRGGLSRPEAIAAARSAGARRLGTEGAAYGGAYGFGSTEGDLGDRMVGGATNALIGGAAGLGLARVGNAVVSGNPLPAAARNALATAPQIQAAQSANALNIRVPRFVAGGPTAQNAGNRLDNTIAGHGTIQGGVSDMIGDSRAARDVIASRAGTVLEPEGMGEAARAGGKKAIKRTSDKGNQYYVKAERLTGNARVPLSGAASELDGQIADLADTPGVTPKILDTIQGIRSRIDGEWSPKGIRRMRTQLTDQFVESGMGQSDASRRARLIAEAAESDMVAGLMAAGKPEAARAWQNASRYWKARLTQLEEVIEPILGKDNAKTGQDVARALEANARGNGRRLGSFIRTMPREEGASIEASLINGLGRSNSGAQNAAGDAFSLDTFLTHWDQIRSSRNIVFSRQTRTDLNHLAAVAQRAKEAGRTRNNSRTGADISAAMMGGQPILGAGAAMATGSVIPFGVALITAAGTGLAQFGGAKLLAAPGFARRLANTPANPAAAARFWSSPWVAKMARSNPSIGSNLTGFQQFMLRAANDNAANVGMRSAASSPSGADAGNEQDKRR